VNHSVSEGCDPASAWPCPCPYIEDLLDNDVLVTWLLGAKCPRCPRFSLCLACHPFFRTLNRFRVPHHALPGRLVARPTARIPPRFRL
jgi:hypothetical protein